ncbi:hypothetical protein B0O99DRAFT_242601 [Bisporella sp. PMI_857]|nr:hypothetical protein B0O99DRAFT_242601 [Bisporella sp. PMI_857]
MHLRSGTPISTLNTALSAIKCLPAISGVELPPLLVMLGKPTIARSRHSRPADRASIVLRLDQVPTQARVVMEFVVAWLGDDVTVSYDRLEADGAGFLPLGCGFLGGTFSIGMVVRYLLMSNVREVGFVVGSAGGSMDLESRSGLYSCCVEGVDSLGAAEHLYGLCFCVVQDRKRAALSYYMMVVWESRDLCSLDRSYIFYKRGLEL